MGLTSPLAAWVAKHFSPAQLTALAACPPCHAGSVASEWPCVWPCWHPPAPSSGSAVSPVPGAAWRIWLQPGAKEWPGLCPWLVAALQWLSQRDFPCPPALTHPMRPAAVWEDLPRAGPALPWTSEHHGRGTGTGCPLPGDVPRAGAWEAGAARVRTGSRISPASSASPGLAGKCDSARREP